ncbi:MAG: type I restriction endonuclease, partial [Bryobacterales bacterium]|nr:type I restriction endonuclease [Bryobacterales bacterium]
MPRITESTVEAAALDWLRDLGYRIVHAPEPGPHGLRETYAEVVLPQVLRDRLAHLNLDLPADALDDAFRKLTTPQGATLEARNRSFHRMLVDGVTVEYRHDDGTVRGDPARVFDFDDPTNNDFL